MKRHVGSRNTASIARIGAFALLALVHAGAAFAQAYTISQVPLVVPSALEPNIILTLEDSTAMRNAFAPDSLSSLGATRRFKSSTFNPLYYDPNVTYVAPPNASSTATSFSNALINGFYVGNPANSWTINLGSEYRPTLSYRPTSTKTASVDNVYADHAAADLGTGAGQLGTNSATQGVAAYYYVFNASNVGCGGATDTGNDACYTLRFVTAAEQQNFAIWYSFYRTRNLAMASAGARAMNDPRLAGTRVGWQALNSCASLADNAAACDGYTAGGSSSSVSNLLNEFDSTQRDNLFAWLRRVPATGTVPMRSAMARAGDYYSKTGTPNNPYLKNPQSAAGSTNPQYSCRPNFHLLMAGSAWDGTTSTFCSGTACGNKDAAGAITLPAGIGLNNSASFTVGAPFSDTNSDSLADVAFHYWRTDLRTDTGMTNNVSPYYVERAGDLDVQNANWKNDPATWQHMVNLVVGVGIKGTVGFSNANTPPPPLQSPSVAWQATGVGSSPGNLYDLWHAAVNSRGRFFGADTPSEIAQAVTDSLRRASEIQGQGSIVGAGLATNSTRLTTDQALYQAKFLVSDWTGRLTKIPVDQNGTPQTAGRWDAADGLAAAATTRKIFTWTIPSVDGGSGGPTGVEFKWSSLPTGIQTLLGGASTTVAGFSVTGQQIVDFLRGDNSMESPSSGPTSSNPFRNRTKALGDIINSDIVYASDENFGYVVLSEGSATDASATDYGNFVRATKEAASRPEVIYVSSNGGMLHAFTAAVADNSIVGGTELFAYVPRAALAGPISVSDPRSALVQLADPGYTHRYFVDGSPWVGDAYITRNSTSQWRTVLIGTTGAGGKGVFALDVTNPQSFSASSALWDLTAANDNDLGYTIGQAVIGRLNDGKFYAIFGNGYRSVNECAVLYLVRLEDGLVRRISTTSATNCSTEPNGLGRPSLRDLTTDRITDYIYAGDVRGNLWKFDVRSIDPAQWEVFNRSGSTKTPLFTARNSCGGIQPITGLIEVGKAPSTMSGAMLYFGTGRYFSIDDRTDNTRQAFYGLFDRDETARLNDPSGSAADPTCVPTPASPPPAGYADRSKLVAQTLGTRDASNKRTFSSTATVDYTATGSSRRDGWYFSFSETGERLVNAPVLLPGRLLMSTLIPSNDPCLGGGESFLLAADPFNGGKTSTNIFSVSSNVTYDGLLLREGIVKNLIAIDAGGKVFIFAAGSKGGDPERIDTVGLAKTGGPIRGRTGWREIFR